MSECSNLNEAYRDKNTFGLEINRNLKTLNATLVALTKVGEGSEETQNLLQQILNKLNITSNKYNNNEQFIVNDTSTLILGLNLYHTISYIILSGTANVTEAGVLLSQLLQGYSASSEATTLLENLFIFTGLSMGTKIVVRTIK